VKGKILPDFMVIKGRFWKVNLVWIVAKAYSQFDVRI
jgi:hypothetical protein